MASRKPTHAPPAADTPWYGRAATTIGRPLVLGATLIMSMPGEYHVARFAGWSDPWAYGMPFSLSAYAGIAAVVAATRPKGARGRASATLGAALAIVLALAAQVVAHLSATGHMDHNQAWLIGVTSTVPPAVLAHLLHLAATPTGVHTPSVPVAETAVERVDTPPLPAAPPALTATPQTGTAAVQPTPAAVPPTPVQTPADARPTIYSDPRCHAIRPLYDSGYRPGTASMRQALADAGHGRPADSVIRGQLRAEVEYAEPHLASLPPETTPIRRGA